jgi:aerobic carbon-monoxide dehydrogenase small subunit
MKKELIELRVNGRTHELAIQPNGLLLDVLRQELNLTGSKRGCDDSSCGACTVQIDGVPMLAALQKAYGDFGGSQCGYCTPGFMMTVRWLLANNPDPTEEEIREALSSNLCRCTGYSQMYQAIRAVIEAERNDNKPELAGVKS